MKRNSVSITIMAISLLASGLAFAQGDGQRDEAKLQAEIERAQAQKRGEQPKREQVQRAPQRNNDRNYQARPERPYNPGYANDYRRDDRRYDSNNYYRYDERRYGPGYQNYQLRRGGYLPPQYRHRQYIVEDWRGHRLSRPPVGYHWVQVGGDYVLVAITTGIILQLLLNN
jgi:Ni/Co efflux regulator RcnB